MLRALGIPRVRLLTNNPDKVASLAAYGIAVERHSLLVAANGINDTYLATKASRFGHFIWTAVALPLLNRPVWLIPVSLGLICVGGAVSTITPTAPRTKQRRS